MTLLTCNLSLALATYAGVHFSQTTSLYPILSALFIPPTLSPFFVKGSFAWSYASFIVAFGAYIVIYRLSPLHPLYKYPGPLLPRITKLYLAYIALKGKQHIWMKEMHDRYGDVIRVAPNELSFITPSSIKPILGPNGMPKAASYTGRVYNPNPLAPTPLPAIRLPNEHARRRKPWQVALSGENIKNYTVRLEHRIQQLVECLEQFSDPNSHKIADLSVWFERFMYDLMADMTFDGGSELMKNGDTGGIWDMMALYFPYAYLSAHLPWLPPIIHQLPIVGKFLSMALPKISLDGTKRFRQFAIEQATARKERGSLNKDLFYHFLTAAEGSDNPIKAWTEVLSDTSSAIIGGSDTTSSTLAHLFYFLVTHPDKYKRLQIEIDQDAANGGNGELPYANAVINETLRLYPPGLSGSPRSPLIGSGGVAFDGHFISEDTTCYIPFYALHRNPKYFTDPDSFVPERWLDDSLDKSAFVPFSYGPYNCVGKNMATTILRDLTKALVSRMEFTLVEDKTWNRQMWAERTLDYYVTVKGALPVRVTLR